MCAWQSGGGGSPPFSGAKASNISAGQTFADNITTAPSLIQVRYDTDSYLTPGSSFTAPKAGYYAVQLGFISDSPFIGHWELQISGLDGLTSLASGSSVANQNPEGVITDEGHLASGGVVTLFITQTSGSGQLMYPVAAIHYLGS